MAQSEDGANDDDGSESSDSLLRDVARIDEATSDAVHVPRTPGSRIGRFVLRGELGRGGMGVVYRAFDDTLNRSVALKVLPALAGAKADEAKARLLREARAAASLEHQHVVAIYEVGEHEGALFIAMELVVGQTLRARMQEPSSLAEKIGWLVEIAEALSAAHDKGIVHRDVKPENVMIKRDGHVKVLDFGIARQSAVPIDPSAPTETSDVRLGTLTAEGAVVGTPRYMAPEQLKGERLDGRCDQFAWGVVGYELFAGKPPWEASDAVSLIASILGKDPAPLSEVAQEVPSAIAAVVEKTLSKSPDARFASMRDVVDAMGRLGRATAKPLAPTEPRPRRGWAITAGLVVVALAGATLGLRGVDRASSVAVASASAPSSSSAPGVLAPAMSAHAVSSNPAAAAAFAAGMQAWRDANWSVETESFERALKIDEGVAAASLRLAWGNFDTPDLSARLFAQASAHRMNLDAHDLALLNALAPCLQQQPADAPECIRRLEGALQSFPDDAELLVYLATYQENYGMCEAAIKTAERAIAVDPSLAIAYVWKESSLSYLGRLDEALSTIDRCLEAAPSAGVCLQDRAEIKGERGDCGAMESDARRMLAISPGSSFGYLAQAQFALGRPLDTVRATKEQQIAAMVGINEAYRERHRLGFEWKLTLFSGDFARAEGQMPAVLREYATDPNRSTHDQNASALIDLQIETGRVAEAGKSAAAYLAQRDAWSPTPFVADEAMRDDQELVFLAAERRAGLIDASELAKRRDAWAHAWELKAQGPVYRPFIWIYAYGFAETTEEAKRAIHLLPRYGGLPLYRPHHWVDAYLGRTLLLAGKVDEAISVLGAKSCKGLTNPIELVRRSLFLGQALEQSGNKEKACEAYAFVLKHWGNAKPKSVTAEEAKKRSKALGCPR